MPETRQMRRMTSKVEKKPDLNDVVCISEGEEEEDDSPPEIEIQKKMLRQRWELASVLNFFNVFEPVIQSNLKISAEEIETALIEPNDALAQLHLVLLKGVAPSSKMLKVSDAWVSVLAKKLESWWPWVAEGEFPLTATKGEEMNRYKELDPAIRLRILKALCELRADRDDIVTYINDSMKNGTGPCPFQKEKLGEDGKGTLYWCDGNEDIGYRLYKEVQVALKPKVKGEVDRLGIISQWETLATNLEEFHKAVCKFSSSKVQLEVKVAKAVEADVLPTLERLQKKKERVLKQQKKQEKLMAALRNSRVIRMGRNRTRRPVSYKFEDYDKAIEEAIEVTQQKKISRRRYGGEREPAYTSGSESVESDSSSEDHQGVNEDQNANDEREDVRCDHDNHFNNLNVEENNVGDTKSWPVRRTNASRCNEGFAGNIDMNVDESGTSLTPKQKLRKRPTTSTSVKSSMISDAEDENSYEDANKRIRVCGNSSEVASTDEDDFSR